MGRSGDSNEAEQRPLSCQRPRRARKRFHAQRWSSVASACDCGRDLWSLIIGIGRSAMAAGDQRPAHAAAPGPGQLVKCHVFSRRPAGRPRRAPLRHTARTIPGEGGRPRSCSHSRSLGRLRQVVWRSAAANSPARMETCALFARSEPAALRPPSRPGQSRSKRATCLPAARCAPLTAPPTSRRRKRSIAAIKRLQLRTHTPIGRPRQATQQLVARRPTGMESHAHTHTHIDTFQRPMRRPD